MCGPQLFEAGQHGVCVCACGLAWGFGECFLARSRLAAGSSQQDHDDRVTSEEPVDSVSACRRGGGAYAGGVVAHILLMNLSLLMGLPFFPCALRGVSVHISFAFSNTMLQCLSKALTLARSFLLLRHETRTWLWLRTAVWRMERGPAVNSCSSTRATSYSLMGG